MLRGVLLLSRIIGEDVAASDAAAVGRLADLTVGIDGEVGREFVERVVITRRDAAPAILPCHAITSLRPGRVSLGVPAAELDGFAVRSVGEALSAEEILLARDVLDTQVVDVAGQRLARVADVVLRHAAGPGLEVVGVEVGFGGVLRRLGLGRLVTRSTEDVVAWPDLHLTSERGQAVQLSAPRAAVHRLEPRGLAALVSRVDTDAATEILASKDPAVAAEVVRVSHPDVGERMLRALPRPIAERIIAAMPAEHAGHWRERLARHTPLTGRRFLRSRVWPHRRHLIRGGRR